MAPKENVYAGTAYYNARRPTGCADAAGWVRFARWAQNRLLLDVRNDTGDHRQPRVVIADKGAIARRGIKNIESLATKLKETFSVTIARSVILGWLHWPGHVLCFELFARFSDSKTAQ